MSRLTELIEELCPDGVEFRPLSDLVRIRNGCDYKTLSPGNVPVYGSGGVMTHVSEALGEGPTVLIPRKGSLDNIFFVEGEFWTVDTIFYTEIASDLDPKFFYYKMKTMHLSQMNEAAGVPSMNQRKLGRIQIPVPPLEVQREIVRILDQFTTLEAELEAELEARRTQYEHYRNHLLSMTALKQRCGEIAVRKLGEVGVFHGGLTGKTKADFVDSPDASAFVTYKEIYSRIEIDSIPVGRVQVADKEKQLALQYGDVLFTGSSENSEEVGMTAVVTSEFSERVYLNSFSICFRWSEELFDPGYAKHMFNSPEIRREIQRCASGVTRFNLSKKRMEKISVPVPPLEVQHEIMRVLDDFDALVNDISSGLPAEIAARRAQYEHYRDRLLSFPEKAASGDDAS
ncbi:restriction endonuclease subunit S [Pauljensenia sp. 20925_1_91]